MSNIKIAQPVTNDQIRDTLARRCPDLELGGVGPMITASSSGWGGAWIKANKKVISVMPGARNASTFALFMIIALTGIGLVIFAVTVLPRWMAATKRVEAVLAEELAGPPRP